MSLKVRLTLIFLLLSILPMTLVGYLAFKSGQEKIEEDTRNFLISVNTLKESELQRWVLNNQHDLIELAQRPLVVDYAQILISHDLGAAEYQRSAELLYENHFFPILNIHDDYESFLIIRPKDGMIIVATDLTLIGKFRESEDFFINGKVAPFVQNTSYSLSDGQGVMHISTPIEDQNGDLVAVLVGHVNLDTMSEIMAKYGSKLETEDTYLVNSYNFFVTEPRYGQNYTMQKAIYTQGVQDCLTGEDGVAFYDDYRDVPVIGAYLWISDRELCILTEIDQSEAFATIQALRSTITRIAVLIATFVLLIGIYTTRSLTEPLIKLVEGAKAIGRGELNYQVRVKTKNEIGQVADSFNQMVGNLNHSLRETARLNVQLQQRAEDLEERVAERTKELEISHNKALEMMHEVSRANQELEDEITERVRAEEEKQQMEIHLLQQQKLESIGTLASGVAHEINNPLMGIMNYAQLIHNRIDPAEDQLREFAGEIVFESERVAEIVRNLLTFSRQEKESHSLVQISTIVNGTLSLIRTIIKRDQIRLEVDLPDNLPQIKCRSQQIQQVLMNLLTNARDALNEHYPAYDSDKVISLRVNLFKKEGRKWLRITVEDHGVGIPDKNRERIFDPFYTSKDRALSTGLGLSISLGIVQDHHGKLTFESEEGQPTRFYLDLPVDNVWETGTVNSGQ
ncbi:MAG: HAMP domain-containing protein [Anaerolineae bacterium]|jgi:signal transduction histidine kinase|nr:HAMP domain-containing protein [Anaerolineae bacterium]